MGGNIFEVKIDCDPKFTEMSKFSTLYSVFDEENAQKHRNLELGGRENGLPENKKLKNVKIFGGKWPQNGENREFFRILDLFRVLFGPFYRLEPFSGAKNNCRCLKIAN